MSDFWGCLKIWKENPIDNLHIMMCKQILQVQKQTTNIGVLLELGRIPITIFAQKASLKNWERIRKKHANTLLCASYDDAYTTNLPWMTNIKSTLERNGMMCFFINTFQDKPLFISNKLFLRLSDEFHQNALERINNNQSKLRTYNLLKQNIGTEHYLHVIRNPLIRKTMTKFRLSNHTLMIEKGRHLNIPKEQRFCPFCKDKVECEMHFLITCPFYKTLRCDILEPMINLRPNYHDITDVEKFQYLMSDENTKISARFLSEAFALRESLLASQT